MNRIIRENREEVVVFKKGGNDVVEVIGLYKRKGLANAVYQKWKGDRKAIQRTAVIDIEKWIEKEELTEEEFEELKRKIFDNAVLWR